MRHEKLRACHKRASALNVDLFHKIMESEYQAVFTASIHSAQGNLFVQLLPWPPAATRTARQHATLISGLLPFVHYFNFPASTSIWDTWAPTVNLSWASLMQAAPFVSFQFSFNAREMVSFRVLPSVFTPWATVERSLVSGGSVTSSPTLGDTKSFGPPELAPMTGVLQAMHLTKTNPKGSLKDGKQPSDATVYISAS